MWLILSWRVYLAAVDELEKASNANEKDVSYLTADRLHELNRPRDGGATSAYLSDDKIKSIMSFLDEVQISDRISAVEQVSSLVNVFKLVFAQCSILIYNYFTDNIAAVLICH